MTSAYDEAIEFLAGGMTPEELLAFKPSPAASGRFEELIGKEKSVGLLPEEHQELERTMEIERMLALAKARARARLARIGT